MRLASLGDHGADVALSQQVTGDGNWAEPGLELRTEPHLVKQCADTFDAVWARAVPHDQYNLL
ncbi:DUF6879 family protein [Streptomyces sp. NPDC057291]|uniref:DUF6879 family protein n=1 Tax=Streptomyces sp. NPDC057291 TaxID=3346087 RepID=UPI0036272B7E